jgi:hypothetical protein
MDRGKESSGQRKSLPEDPGGSDRDFWHKHLASRRPPAPKRRKVRKAESARDESLPGLQESLQWPPDGKDIVCRGAHAAKLPYQTLPVNDFVLLPKPAALRRSTGRADPNVSFFAARQAGSGPTRKPRPTIATPAYGVKPPRQVAVVQAKRIDRHRAASGRKAIACEKRSSRYRLTRLAAPRTKSPRERAKAVYRESCRHGDCPAEC